MPGGRPTLEERAHFDPAWKTAENLGLTYAEFKGRVNKGLLPPPSKIINGRWNFDRDYADKVKVDPEFNIYLKPEVVPEPEPVPVKKATKSKSKTKTKAAASA